MTARTAIHQKLLHILQKALHDHGATEFDYAWEWEVSLIPEHFLAINEKDICGPYGIDFDFGEIDLDKLVAAGYFEKNVLVNTDTQVLVTYRLLDFERQKPN